MTGTDPAQPAHVPPAAPSPAAPSGRPPTRRLLLIAGAVAAVVSAGVGAGTAAAVASGSAPSGQGLAVSTQQAPTTAKLDGTISAAAAKIGPSVVTIDVRGAQLADTGSGVIVRSDGYILTNDHVIAAAATGGAVTVVTANGRTAPAKIVGRDSADDLAMIKIGLPHLTAASFAPSHNLVVGQAVVAVGAPLGLSQTVTSGIVSSTARPVRAGANDQAVFDAVQTDAPINPGNSGGPLVNLNGDVVGIDAAIATTRTGGLQIPGQSAQPGSIGIGFAIPSDEAARIAGQLIATGHATHAMLGVEVQRTTAAATGAQLVKVTPGSPAAHAGLHAGDVVTEFAGQRIGNADALIAAVRSHAPGQRVRLTYTRGGSPHTVTLTLGSSEK